MKLNFNKSVIKLIYFLCIVFLVIMSLFFHKDERGLFFISCAIFGVTWNYSLYSKELKKGWIFLFIIFLIYLFMSILKREYENILSYTFAITCYSVYCVFSLISFRKHKRFIHPPRGGRFLPDESNSLLDILFSLILFGIAVVYGIWGNVIN